MYCKYEAEELLNFLSSFIKENKELYPTTMYRPQTSLKVNRVESKKAWRVTGGWSGRYGCQSSEVWIIPDLLIVSPKLYREQRVSYRRHKKKKEIESMKENHQKQITTLEEQLSKII